MSGLQKSFEERQGKYSFIPFCNKGLKYGPKDYLCNLISYDRQNPNNSSKITNYDRFYSQLTSLMISYESLFIETYDFPTKINITRLPDALLYERLGRIKDSSGWELENDPKMMNQSKFQIKKLIDDYLKYDIISELNKKPKYLNPIDVKLVDNYLRLKLWPDYSYLNKIYNLLIDFDSIVYRIALSIPKSRLFSFLDLKDAPFQIVLDKTDREMTSFKFQYGDKFRYFQFNTMHERMDNCRIEIHKRIEAILDSVQTESVKILGSQILICTLDIDSHLHYLERIFCLLKQANAKLSVDHTVILSRSITFYDFVIHQMGISLSHRFKNNFFNENYLKSFLEDDLRLEWFKKKAKNLKKFARDEFYDKNFQILLSDNFISLDPKEKEKILYYFFDIILKAPVLELAERKDSSPFSI